MKRIFLVGLLVWVGPACGGSGGGAPGGGLDCAWLAGDNCWKTTADDAATCLPPADAQGTLSADNKTCTYATGEKVAFTPALVLPPPDDVDWNFTISKGGVDCLHYENTKTGLKLVVMGKTVTEKAYGFTGITVTCPDGTAQSNSDIFSVLSCGADGGLSFGGLPGHGFSSTDRSLSVTLLGASSSLPLFDCQHQP